MLIMRNHLLAIDETTVSFFDRENGFTFDITTDSFSHWGESHSCNWAQCVNDCIGEKLYKVLAEMGINYISDGIWKFFWTGASCAACRSRFTDPEKRGIYCEDCLTKLLTVGPYGPVVRLLWLGARCGLECKMIGVYAYGCQAGDTRKRCSNPWIWGPNTIVNQHCTNDCIWIDNLNNFLKDCGNKVCKQIDKNYAECKDPSNTSSSTQENTTASDPNIKYGPEGYVIAGQALNYRVQFENEGEGIAFGVYFTDTLDEDLDDSTLVIGPVISTIDQSIIAPPGTYNPSTRTITWLVGEVGPSEGGYADVSVNIRSDAPNGTEIINYGTVYFPSVPEETRTNGIVSVVSLDTDGDGITDNVDNCPYIPNSEQEDNDGDGVGNVCDNCWEVSNPDQLDSDSSCYGPPYFVDPACGDACIVIDSDGDGVPDDVDNCPNDANPSQENFDTDGIGDVCDTCTDLDGDGYGREGLDNSGCIHTEYDCNDCDLAIYPGATETCNGKDDDCDVQTDEGLGTTTCGIGECKRTVDNCVSGVPQQCVPGDPTPEICDDKDNDCDGSTDEDLTRSCGTGVCTGMQKCSAGVWSNCSTYNNECDSCALCSETGECNMFKPSSTICRPSAGVCDVVEYCTGISSACPLDTHQPDGTSCADSDLCDGEETCREENCVSGTALNCDDENICTDDSCNPLAGCQHVNNNSPCDDEDACTVNDTCSEGICVGSSLLDCDDLNICTNDSCDSETGCIHTNNNLPCDDGNPNTENDVCVNGTCIGTPIVNHSPVITSIPVTEATAGTLYTYDVEATDEDDDTLTYALTENPSGMTINNGTGLIEWTPTQDQVGTHAVTVEVDDEKGGTDSQSFTITVKGADLTPPVIRVEAIPFFVKKGKIVTIKLRSNEALGEVVVTVWQVLRKPYPVAMQLDTSTADPYDYVGTFNTAQASLGLALVQAEVRDLSGNRSVTFNLFFIWR